MRDREPGGPVEAFGRLIDDLEAKAKNAARRGKPTMWAYYEDMLGALVAYFGPVTETDGGYAGAALALSQKAVAECPTLDNQAAARLWALGVYARRILVAWGAGNGGPVSLKWLRERVA